MDVWSPSPPPRVSARLQLSAERYRSRRVENALRCGEPERSAPRSAFLAGGGAAAILLAGCLLLASVLPAPALGDAPIVVDRQAGALYVRLGQTLHPVANLVSARLITASDTFPRAVEASVIRRAHRGVPLGIAGAPQSLGEALPPHVVWSMCSGRATHDDLGAQRLFTAVLANPIEARGGADPDDTTGPAVAVTADGRDVHLLHRGQRRPAGRLADLDVTTAGAVHHVSPQLLEALSVSQEHSAADPIASAVAARVSPDESTVCVHWRPRSDGAVTASVTTSGRLPIPPGDEPVALRGDDSETADAVYLPPGRYGYVRAAGPNGALIGPRYLIADTGTRFVIPDDDTATRSLGLPGRPTPIAWPVLAVLPPGPELSRDAALAGWHGSEPTPAALGRLP